jgi:hypothetical protein
VVVVEAFPASAFAAAPVRGDSFYRVADESVVRRAFAVVPFGALVVSDERVSGL